MTALKRLIGHAAFGVFTLAVSCAIVESVLLVLLHVPRLTAALPRPARRLVQQVYRHFNRSLIQFDRNCSQYDPGLTYTLKPGACTFENIEFRTNVKVNRLGLRDDEAALSQPEVIVLGDSHAMGWGVEHDETFSHVLSEKTGLRVLDAGVSSYGTVREMMLLDRLDVSHLRALVIQYSDNDLAENRSFREHDNHLPIASQAQYDAVTHYYRRHPYFPGKYLYRLAMKVSRLEAPEPEPLAMEPATPLDEARLFLNAVRHAGQQRLDTAVQLIVLEINESLPTRQPFMLAVDKLRVDDANPPFVQRLVALDLSQTLTAADFFVLDDHMNRAGHRIVGEALAGVVRAHAPAAH